MEVKRGTRISLNKRIRSYYFQGPNGINLRSEVEEMTIIPESITDYNLAVINNSINRGHLIVGWPEEPTPEVRYKEDDSKILDNGVKKARPFLEKIAVTYGKGDDSPVARLEKLLGQEKSDKKRKTVIETIEGLLNNMAGISAVDEDYEDKEEVKINLG